MTSAPSLESALDLLLRFGALMLRSGDAAFRVRDAMSILADKLGIEKLALHITVTGLSATAERGAERVTIVREVGPPGVNAGRLAALEQLARRDAAELAVAKLPSELDAIETASPLHSIFMVAAAVGLASGSFAYLNGGNLAGVLVTVAAGGGGQALRLLLFGHRLNQYVVTALCAAAAAGLFVLLSLPLERVGLSTGREVGIVSSVLFLVPGFPLVAGFLDLLQHQTVAALVRLAYGMMLLAAAAFGLGVVVAVAGYGVASAPPAGEPLWLVLLLRAVASFAGGLGFAALYNSPPGTGLAVGVLAAVGNELRLALADAGLTLASATFVGAFAVGLMAPLARKHLRLPRIILSVPSIIIMVPGRYAFEAAVLFNQGDVLGGLRAAIVAAFVVGAMAFGLFAARVLTERKWLIEG